jgi:hypothetical protein
MAKKIKLSESDLIELIENSVQKKIKEQEEDMVLDDLEIIDEPILSLDMDDEEEEDELEGLLSPEEIAELTADQIEQLQDRVQYVEELNADILEFMETLMSELADTPEELRKLRSSRRILNQLQTRAGREIFWLKSRRLN